MGQCADGRGCATNRRPDFKRHRGLQPVPLSRHAGANCEKVAGLDAEDRPAGDDLLDGEDALAESKFLFHRAIDGQLDVQGFYVFA